MNFDLIGSDFDDGIAAPLFFATWWRYSHTQEKIRYDKYYAMLRAEQAALAEE